MRGELPMEEDIVEKQKQWISVALRTESDSALNSKHNGKSSALLAVAQQMESLFHCLFMTMYNTVDCSVIEEFSRIY